MGNRAGTSSRLLVPVHVKILQYVPPEGDQLTWDGSGGGQRQDQAGGEQRMDQAVVEKEID